MTIADNSDLCIALSAREAKRHRLYHFWLPALLLVCCLFFLFFLNKRDIAGWLKWLPFLAVIASLFLLFTKYTVSIQFTDTAIKTKKKMLGLTSTSTYSLSDLQNFALLNKGINFLYVFTKKGKQKLLFSFWKDENDGTAIAAMISKKTGLPFQKDQNGTGLALPIQ